MNSSLNRWAAPLFTLAVVGVFALYVVGAAFRTGVPKSKYNGLDLELARRIPIVEGGRIKPLDTYVRTALRLNNAGEEFEGADDKRYPAIVWFLETLAFDSKSGSRSGLVWNSQMFKIDNDQLRGLLGLDPRSGLRYALREFYGKFDKLESEAKLAAETPKDRRDLYQVKVMEFHDRLGQFTSINQLNFRAVPPSDADPEWQIVAKREHFKQARIVAMQRAVERFNIDPEKKPKLTPQQEQAMLTFVENEREAELKRLQESDPDIKPWLDLAQAYRRKNADDFNRIAGELVKNAEKLTPRQQSALKWEILYNRLAPFYQCTGMYVTAAVLGLAGLLIFGWRREYAPPLLWSAFALTGLSLLVHIIGITMRIYIQGRPPVTNLYSSAVFIGAGCVLLCMVLERVYPIGLANLVGSTLGFITTIIAHNLGSDRDTLEMMQAVLDTNFWLATHVTIITFGYVATYVAGFLATVFILLGLCTPILDRPTFKAVSGMIYGTLCFATLLSFVGTVLGGIWADESWGRFWGWDPKENGAMLIVMWNAMVLHARWGGMVKQRGTAVLAVLGNVVTTWSWFGTNMLGVGLHSYASSNVQLWSAIGFLAFWGSVIAFALAIPLNQWSSNGEQFVREVPKGQRPESKARVPAGVGS